MSCRAEEEGAVGHWSSRSGWNPWRGVVRHESHPGGEIQTNCRLRKMGNRGSQKATATDHGAGSGSAFGFATV